MQEEPGMMKLRTIIFTMVFALVIALGQQVLAQEERGVPIISLNPIQGTFSSVEKDKTVGGKLYKLAVRVKSPVEFHVGRNYDYLICEIVVDEMAPKSNAVGYFEIEGDGRHKLLAEKMKFGQAPKRIVIPIKQFLRIKLGEYKQNGIWLNPILVPSSDYRP
jgi:hypothetical protein